MSWRALCLRCCVLSLALPEAAAVGGNPRPIVVFWTGADALACKHDARDAHAAAGQPGKHWTILVSAGLSS